MFVDVLSGNASMPTELFRRLGGFEEKFAAHRREDYDLGVRALRAGVRAVHAPDAVARHEFRLSTRGAIAASGREGSGDALLAARWPEVVSTLPPAIDAPRGLSRGGLGSLISDRFASRGVPVALDALERLRLRGLWLRIFYRAMGATYQRARREMAAKLATPPPPEKSEMLTVELSDGGPIAPPSVAAPLIRVCWRGQLLDIVRPLDGQWSPTELAMQITDVGNPDVWAGMVRAEERESPASLPSGEFPEIELAPPCGNAAAWRALDGRLGRSQAPVVVVSFERRANFTFPQGALDVLASPRVGLVFGGRSGQSVLGPAEVFSREVPYKGRGFPGDGVRYLAIRPEVLRQIGGLDGRSVRWGIDAITDELFERVLGAGYHAAKQDVPGPDRQLRRTQRAWIRDRAAGAKAVRGSAAAGPRAGMVPALRLLPFSRRPLSLGFRWLAFAAGGIGGLRDLPPQNGSDGIAIDQTETGPG